MGKIFTGVVARGIAMFRKPHKKEMIGLDQRQILELEVIVVDRDKEAALKFLEAPIYRPIKKKKQAHCKPPF